MRKNFPQVTTDHDLAQLFATKQEAEEFIKAMPEFFCLLPHTKIVSGYLTDGWFAIRLRADQGEFFMRKYAPVEPRQLQLRTEVLQNKFNKR